MLTPLMAIQLVKVPESDQMGHSDLSKDIMEIAKKCLGSVPEEVKFFLSLPLSSHPLTYIKYLTRINA